MKTGATVARLLRRIAGSIEGLDGDDLDRFVRELSLHPPASTARPNGVRSKAPAKRTPISSVELEQIFNELERAPTRQAGLEVLMRQQMNRDELVRLAKLRKIHVTKDDNIARITDKLIETFIGARLGSLAIRGE